MSDLNEETVLKYFGVKSKDLLELDKAIKIFSKYLENFVFVTE